MGYSFAGYHVNGTCPLPNHAADYLIDGRTIAGSLTFQHLIGIFGLVCLGLTIFLTLWLIFKHLHRYTEPNEQRQIIRLIFTPIVFALFSSLSIWFYPASLYLAPISTLYEAFALAALFLLFVQYLAPDSATREAYFHSLDNYNVKGQSLQGGSLKWLRLKWFFVFSYPLTILITTVAEEVTQGYGAYCTTSLSPKYAHLWILIIENVGVTFAVTSILQFYARVKRFPEFARHKPLLKLLSFKLIVFVNFIQSIIFSVLTSKNIVNPGQVVTMKDWAIGLPNLLICVEQVIFAALFHVAFKSREYHEIEKLKFVNSPDSNTQGHNGYNPQVPPGRAATISRKHTLKAALDALNMMDLILGIIEGFRLIIGMAERHELQAKDFRPSFRIPKSPKGPAATGIPPQYDDATQLKPLNQPGRLSRDTMSPLNSRSSSPPPTHGQEQNQAERHHNISYGQGQHANHVERRVHEQAMQIQQQQQQQQYQAPQGPPARAADRSDTRIEQ